MTLFLIQASFPLLGGLFVAGLLLGLFIQRIRINILESQKLNFEQKMLEMNAEMLGMDDVYKKRKDN